MRNDVVTRLEQPNVRLTDISYAKLPHLPAGSDRNTVVALTYCVVVFSIRLQGLSIGYAVRKPVARR